MKKPAKSIMPTLMGVGIPNENGVPVNYKDPEGQLFTVYITGLGADDVIDYPDGEKVNADLAKHALATLKSIVDDDAEYKQRIIDGHVDDKALILRYEAELKQLRESRQLHAHATNGTQNPDSMPIMPKI